MSVLSLPNLQEQTYDYKDYDLMYTVKIGTSFHQDSRESQKRGSRGGREERDTH